MNLCEKVFNLSEKFMEVPQYVTVNYPNISDFCNKLKEAEVTPPSFPPREGTDDALKTCLKELIGDSINYCYWYGKDTVRPLDCSSGKMYSIIDSILEVYEFKRDRIKLFQFLIDELCGAYMLERFPLIEERIKHLNELKEHAIQYILGLFDEYNNHGFEFQLKNLLINFPGYGSDLFLKRAFLFFAQLNRMYGMFEEYMMNTPIPADYQVPKMLEYYNLIDYNANLKYKIYNYQIIPKGSLEECEIRAASIIACREIGKQLNWTMPQVDGLFWLRRKEVNTPFHLTITTDY